MKREVGLLQMLIRDMRVDLRRPDIAVAEQELDRAQIGAVTEQGGGKTVAKDVGGDVVDSRCRPVVLDQSPESLASDRARATLEKEQIGRVVTGELGADRQVPSQIVDSGTPERNPPLLTSLPKAVKNSLLKIEIAQFEIEQL